jgi:hypothetical protein
MEGSLVVAKPFSGFLFEFCVLGVVPDFEGESVVSPPPRSSVCVELAASLLETSLPHCRASPQRRCKVSRDTFQFSPDCLRDGTGVQFASSLCDGTWKIGSQSIVCDTLNILRHAQGTFPYNFHCGWCHRTIWICGWRIWCFQTFISRELHRCSWIGVLHRTRTIPAVKSFGGTTVKTIISGSPLKNLTDLCAGDGGSLLIYDRGGSCIWKLQISDGEIFPLVTVLGLRERSAGIFLSVRLRAGRGFLHFPPGYLSIHQECSSCSEEHSRWVALVWKMKEAILN